MVSFKSERFGLVRPTYKVVAEFAFYPDIDTASHIHRSTEGGGIDILDAWSFTHAAISD